MLRVFKFGGASIKDAHAIKNVANIVGQHQQDDLVIIVSAAGKTTNALEEVLNAYWRKENDLLKTNLDKVKDYHQSIMNELFEDKHHAVFSDVHDIYVDLEWILEEEPQDAYEYG